MLVVNVVVKEPSLIVGVWLCQLEGIAKRSCDRKQRGGGGQEVME